MFYANGSTTAHKRGTGEIATGTYSFIYNDTLEICTVIEVLNGNTECLAFENTENPLGASSCQLYSNQAECVNCNEYPTRDDLRWVTFIATTSIGDDSELELELESGLELEFNDKMIENNKNNENRNSVSINSQLNWHGVDVTAFLSVCVIGTIVVVSCLCARKCFSKKKGLHGESNDAGIYGSVMA